MDRLIERQGDLVAMVIGLVKLCRPRQWVKNGFVFLPLLFSGLFLNTDAIISTAIAALLFSLGASATYIVNDYRDVEKDKAHPEKRYKRPLASGEVSKAGALGLLFSIYATLMVSYFYYPNLVLIILSYLVLNLLYTFYLKHEPVVDIFIIAIGFVLRVYAGASVLDVEVSSWMFVTTLCLALYLASIKRRQELIHTDGTGRSVLENYSVELIDMYAITSAIGSLLFYSLFVLQDNPALIYSIPLVIFGLFRYWYLVHSKNQGESPTDVLLSDIQLIAVVIVWGGVIVYSLSPIRIWG